MAATPVWKRDGFSQRVHLNGINELIDGDKAELYGLDVECAKIKGENRPGGLRYPCSVALIFTVDGNVNTTGSLTLLIKPSVKGLDYTFAGLTESDVQDAPSLSKVTAMLKTFIFDRRVNGKIPIVIGHSVKKDLEWMNLTGGTSNTNDFGMSFDTTEFLLVRYRDDTLGTKTMRFGLRMTMLFFFETDIQAGAHDPEVDAKAAFNFFIGMKKLTDDELKTHANKMLEYSQSDELYKLDNTIRGKFADVYNIFRSQQQARPARDPVNLARPMFEPPRVQQVIPEKVNNGKYRGYDLSTGIPDDVKTKFRNISVTIEEMAIQLQRVHQVMVELQREQHGLMAALYQE